MEVLTQEIVYLEISHPRNNVRDWKNLVSGHGLA
jgi:hypothetical protein